VLGGRLETFWLQFLEILHISCIFDYYLTYFLHFRLLCYIFLALKTYFLRLFFPNFRRLLQPPPPRPQPPPRTLMLDGK
jgi:hypothetical protein